MYKAIICLGSNAPDACRQLTQACAFLISLGRLSRISRAYPTEPENTGQCAPYLNQLIELHTHHTLDRLRALTKAYESIQRNRRTDTLVAVDIDIVYFDDTLLRPRDAVSAYFRQGLSLLK